MSRVIDLAARRALLEADLLQRRIEDAAAVVSPFCGRRGCGHDVAVSHRYGPCRVPGCRCSGRIVVEVYERGGAA